MGTPARGHAEPARLGPDLAGAAGYFRVPVVALAPRGLTVGGGLAYGYTEPQSAAPGSHHRLGGRATASLTPLAWLGVSLGGNVRYDRHPGDALGPDDGAVIDSEAQARAGWALGDGWHLGAATSAFFSRGSSLGESLGKPSIAGLGVAAYVPAGAPLSVGLMAGYRLDPSASLVADPARYRSGDRLALGVSAFDAIPLGIGAAYRLGPAELVAELSADVLVGAGAPRWLESPLRASAGARYHLSDGVALRVSSDTSLSARPAAAAAALIPVEPRFAVLFGMTCQLLAWDTPPEPPPAPVPAPRPEPAPPALATIQVDVTTLEGDPLSDARVRLEIDGQTFDVPHADMQTYRLERVPARKARLSVAADRLETQSIDVTLDGGRTNVIAVELLPSAVVAGQVRGRVRSFDGRGLRARVRIEPLGTRLATDRDGAFELDLPPGKYQVVIEAAGHETQRRAIEVIADGVVVLNADLLRGAR